MAVSAPSVNAAERALASLTPKQVTLVMNALSTIPGWQSVPTQLTRVAASQARQRTFRTLVTGDSYPAAPNSPTTFVDATSSVTTTSPTTGILQIALPKSLYPSDHGFYQIVVKDSGTDGVTHYGTTLYSRVN